ncbi:MAG: hypothetical protein LRY55_13660 [Leadbetterella sp.]|nr:hypothetical protein [Leadbetterella sp.]
MIRKLFYPVLSLLLLLSCSRRDIENNSLSKDRFLAMSLREQLAALTQWGGITQIDINNLELQRISSGIIRSFPGFSFNYCPAIDIFELAEQSPDTYSIGLRKGGPAGQVLNVAVTLKEGSDSWVEVKGLRYTVQLSSYTAGDGRDVVEYIFTPTGDVPGTSEDYLNLIAALNNSNNGDVLRPDLPISDLRVLSLQNLKLTVVFEQGKTQKTGKAWDTTLASTLGKNEPGATPVDPVYLDTNQDDKLNIAGGKSVCFDINGDGVKDVVHEWNTSDAQLVYDVNLNGLVDDGKEIMNETGIDGTQNKYRNGWAKVRDIFDKNNDGFIDCSELQLTSYWTDANGNGTVEPGELKSAGQLGIITIDIVNRRFIFEE